MPDRPIANSHMYEQRLHVGTLFDLVLGQCPAATQNGRHPKTNLDAVRSRLDVYKLAQASQLYQWLGVSARWFYTGDMSYVGKSLRRRLCLL